MYIKFLKSNKTSHNVRPKVQYVTDERAIAGSWLVNPMCRYCCPHSGDYL